MLPAVAKIVGVLEYAKPTLAADKVAQLRFQRIDELDVAEAVVEQVRIAIEAAADLELVKMRIRPAHGGLNLLVQIR